MVLMIISSLEAIPLGTGAVLGLFAILGCVIYYFLNKRLSLGIREVGSVTSAIEFKRSVIEGKKLSEKDAHFVCDIIEALMTRD